MAVPGTGSDELAGLRREAESRAREESRDLPDDVRDLSAEEARRALHELRVHQIELEMQNEELRRTQGELEASRSRYYDLYELAPVGYLSLNVAGIIIQANLTVAGVLGLARTHLIGRPLASFILPDDQRTHYLSLAHLHKTGERQAYEVQMRRHSGERIWVRLDAIASDDGSPGESAVRVALSDITELKVAQARGREARTAELRAAVARILQEQRPIEDRFSEAIDRMAEMDDLRDRRATLFVIDPATGKLNRLADGTWETTGCPPDALDRSDCLCRVQKTTRGAWPCIDCRSASAARLVDELDGRYAIPLTHVGQTLGLLCVTTDDSTPLGAYEMIPLRQVADLMALALVNERVRQALETARQEAEGASRSKSAFLASMSHELRTPLNTILGTCDALLEGVYGGFNEKQANSIRNVHESGNHLLKLINDILDLSRVEAGQIELELGRDSLDRVCGAALDVVRTLAIEKRLQVKLSVEGADHTVVADQRRLRQILVNLLSNAIKFTPEGGDIGIHAVTDPERRELRLTVWDSGIGIAPEELERLFQPFVQLDSALSRRQLGAGLGLSLVKRMTELHGGRVTVESQVGEGSRFTVVLPWTPPAVEEDHESPIVWDVLTPDRHDRPPLPGGPLILLAEDNESNLAMLSDYLQAKGYRLAVARDGLDAVRLHRECRPDLVLMDVQLPRLDGLEAVRRIREADGVRDVPIVALTSAALPGDRERCLAAGANDYFSKPISLRRLVEKIEELLASE